MWALGVMNRSLYSFTASTFPEWHMMWSFFCLKVHWIFKESGVCSTIAFQSSATKDTIHIQKDGFPKWLNCIPPPQLHLPVVAQATYEPCDNIGAQFCPDIPDNHTSYNQGGTGTQTQLIHGCQHKIAQPQGSSMEQSHSDLPGPRWQPTLLGQLHSQGCPAVLAAQGAEQGYRAAQARWLLCRKTSPHYQWRKFSNTIYCCSSTRRWEQGQTLVLYFYLV